jgi:ABC-type antimicrobial peptide transport system permease subunit
MVVGVVDDVKQTTLEAETTPQVYVPQAQMPYPGLTIVVRTPGEPGQVKDAIDRALHEVDPSLAAHDVRSLADVAGKSLARQRFGMMLVVIFAISSLALAVIGVYGVIALSVSQRRRELGVRLALGAQAADVVRLVVADGMVMTGTGLVVGVVGALLLSRVMASLLYGVSATDPLLFAGAAVTVLAVALVACYLPARRASRVDPTIALRAE